MYEKMLRSYRERSLTTQKFDRGRGKLIPKAASVKAVFIRRFRICRWTFFEFYISYLFFILEKISLSSRTWFKSSWHSHFDVDEKFFDLKQTCRWKHFSSYTSIFMSMLHSLKNIHQHFSSFTSFSASVLYSLKNIHQHFSSHTSVFVSMFHSLRNLHIFQQLDYIIWKIFLFFNNLMKKSW